MTLDGLLDSADREMYAAKATNALERGQTGLFRAAVRRMGSGTV
jgi:hypothetical protein